LCSILSPGNNFGSKMKTQALHLSRHDKFNYVSAKLADTIFNIWITDAQRTDPEYFNDTKNAGYEHSIKP
jgi:hypothetical protein